MTPEDLFKPSKEYPQGSIGEWMAEENGVMVRRIYKDGKLLSSEAVTTSASPSDTAKPATQASAYASFRSWRSSPGGACGRIDL